MRLRGLGLGRVGMKKLKNKHKGRVVRKFRTRECVVRKFRTRECVVRKFRTRECVVRISHKALFTRPNAKLDTFKWP